MITVEVKGLNEISIGLYSAFMGSIIYTMIGTVREVSIGPTSLMSIITVSYTYEKPIEYVFIMTFVCGCVEMLMGIFKLGAYAFS